MEAGAGGRPCQEISFLSLVMMSMAMSTLSASYTRRRMFFSSYAAPPGDPAAAPKNCSVSALTNKYQDMHMVHRHKG